MIELSAAQATSLGWTHRKTRGIPRLVGPSGNEYVRAVMAKPSVCITQDNGSKLFLVRVAMRSGDSLVRLLRARKVTR